MIKMEIVKFMFRYKNKILVKSTNTILDKKIKVDIIIIHLIANLEENDFTIMLKIIGINFFS